MQRPAPVLGSSFKKSTYCFRSEEGRERSVEEESAGRAPARPLPGRSPRPTASQGRSRIPGALGRRATPWDEIQVVKQMPPFSLALGTRSPGETAGRAPSGRPVEESQPRGVEGAGPPAVPVRVRRPVRSAQCRWSRPPTRPVQPGRQPCAGTAPGKPRPRLPRPSARGEQRGTELRARARPSVRGFPGSSLFHASNSPVKGLLPWYRRRRQ